MSGVSGKVALSTRIKYDSSSYYSFTDLVWLPSYSEINSITQANRVRKATDLAKATYTTAATATNYAGNVTYWSRSYDSEDDEEEYVSYQGNLSYTDSYSGEYSYAFCPCFALNV